MGKNAVLSAIQSVSNKRIAPSSLYALKGLSMHTYTIRNSHMCCQTSQEFQFRSSTLCPTFLEGEKTWSTSKKIFFCLPHSSLATPTCCSFSSRPRYLQSSSSSSSAHPTPTAAPKKGERMKRGRGKRRGRRHAPNRDEWPEWKDGLLLLLQIALFIEI